jgi:hypothetical protein
VQGTEEKHRDLCVGEDTTLVLKTWTKRGSSDTQYKT